MSKRVRQNLSHSHRAIVVTQWIPIGTTKRAAGKGGFDKLQSFLFGQTIGRAIAVIGGALKSNTTAKIVIVKSSLPNGAKVRYTVLE